MATSFKGIKEKLDLPSWQNCSPLLTAAMVADTATVGSTLSGDRRASQYKQDLFWFVKNATTLYQYRTRSDGWHQLLSPALTGTFGIGATSVFAPSQGPRGTIAAGATGTSVILSTALPAAIGINQLVGQRIRIVNNIAGGGQTAERTIVANTAGTTPTITVDAAFGFTPGTGVIYELLTGRLYMLSAGALAAGMWKFYDIATNSMSGNLATTNLPATVNTGSTIIALDELHTPITGVNGAAVNGETGGFFGTLTATAATGTTLTGVVGSGDFNVAANEYRNFQIRIVEDTVNPTAVGQRRRITSHTAGPSPVYTVPTWTVTPSANAKYMIENNNDILLWSSASTSTFRYDGVANTWDTTTYAVQPAAAAAGSVCFQPFGTVLNPAKTVRHSFIYKFRGAAGNILDIFDIAGGATGLWTANTPYDNQGTLNFSTGAGLSYSPVEDVALVVPLQIASTRAQTYFYRPNDNSLKAYTPMPIPGAALVDGDRLATDIYYDGTDKKSKFFFIPATTGTMYQTLFFGDQ